LSKQRETDRYLLSGGPIPTIYHGTLTGLNQAIKDAGTASRFLPDTVFTLVAVTGSRSTRTYRNIATFQDGDCTYRAGTEVKP
jgi:hypothetical protein